MDSNDDGGKAIPFIEVDDDKGTFSVNTEAMAILEE